MRFIFTFNANEIIDSEHLSCTCGFPVVSVLKKRRFLWNRIVGFQSKTTLWKTHVVVHRPKTTYPFEI